MQAAATWGSIVTQRCPMRYPQNVRFKAGVTAQTLCSLLSLENDLHTHTHV